jgi:hypothetical protein
MQASYPSFLPSGYGAPEIIISRDEKGELYAAITSIQINGVDEKNNIAIVIDTRHTQGLVHDIDALRELYKKMQKELDHTLRTRLEGGDLIKYPHVPFAIWRDMQYTHPPRSENSVDSESPGYDN